MQLLSPAATLALGTLFISRASAYIPAQGTNDTSYLPADAEDSTVLLRWPNQGTYQESINRQLTQQGGSSGIEKGALAHYWENDTIPASSEITTTPWIALINCDRNSTDASMEYDIFSAAADRGAIASLLYSEFSETCLLNSDYLQPPFTQVFDIYTTITKSSARLIESQFDNVNKTLYYFFNATRLNESSTAIINAVNGSTVQTGFLIATLKWDNVTDPDPGNDGGSGTTTATPTGGSSSNADTGLAMIILYVITGCVSLLFCIVIISGAIRALRHPERYGPRRGDPTMDGPEGYSQTRAAGLTRAILDTFPVVKFGRVQPGYQQNQAPQMYRKPEAEWEPNTMPAHEYPPKDSSELFEMTEKEMNDKGYAPSARPSSRPSSSGYREGDGGRQPNRTSGPPGLQRSNTQRGNEPTPEMIGTETCPICILDFEEGDDLRVLPCEGHHKFHKDCVDQWLLELSSSCPLCRQDFHALENMAHGLSPEETSHLTAVEGSGGSSPFNTHRSSQRGFSRYLRNAQRDHHDAIGEGHEPPHSSG